MNTRHELHEFDVTWLDGRSAKATPARMTVVSGQARVFSAPAPTAVPTEIAADSSDAPTRALLASASVAQVQVSTRMGSVPYRITFPGGGVAVAADHAAVEKAIAVPPATGWLPLLERSPAVVALAIVGLLAALYFGYKTLIPKAAEFVATRIPRSAEQSLGKIALTQLDEWMFGPSQLKKDDKIPATTAFDQLATAAGLKADVDFQFRRMEPNAMALPGATIIVTDDLVKLLQNDQRMLAAVIAHELGHVHHRHSMRRILEGSASAIIVGALAGDVSGMSALATSAPLVLSTLHYTREGEREADRYAYDLLTKIGLSPEDFAHAMRRFQQMELCLALRAKDREARRDKARVDAEASSDEADEDEEDTEEDDAANATSAESKSDVDAKNADAQKSDEKKTEAQSKPRSIRERMKAARMQRSACYETPEKMLEGREADIATLGVHDEQTGYLHTHPVTQERIDAALAAAKAVPR